MRLLRPARPAKASRAASISGARQKRPFLKLSTSGVQIPCHRPSAPECVRGTGDEVGGGQGGFHGADVPHDEVGVGPLLDAEFGLGKAVGTGGQVLDPGGRRGIAATASFDRFTPQRIADPSSLRTVSRTLLLTGN